jgi:hypothetical protein
MGAEDQICQMDTVTLARGITAAGPLASCPGRSRPVTR